MRLFAVVSALVLALLPAAGAAAPAPLDAIAPGAVVALRGTPHLWVAGDDGLLHWAGDTRALAGRFVDWGNKVELSADEVKAVRRGDPWLSAGLVKMGDPIYLVKWETDQAQPTLLHIQSIADVDLFGINASNYGAMVLDEAPWNQKYGFTAGALTKGELPSAVASNRDKPVPIGTAADAGNGWQITIISVTQNATSTVLGYNKSLNMPPREGRQDFIARVEVKRTGSTPAALPIGDIQAIGPANVAYLWALNAFCGDIPDGLLPITAAPGDTATGNICWQVLSTDVANLVAYYATGFGENARYTYFALR